MDDFLRLSMAERRFACLKVEGDKRLQAASVEKDFWICWALRELFGLPGLGAQMTFKGGTSLAKAWGMIDRFSEDIDIVVDKEPLGFAGDASPDRAPSNKQRRRRLDDLMAACRTWVQGDLKNALVERIAARLGDSTKWRLVVDPDADDGQCLLFEYPGAFAAAEAGYVRPVVKIELGARSDDWPSETRTVTPYVAALFPKTPDEFARVPTLAAERTFWEKALLLHEETFRPPDKPRRIRMARHYYDVWCLITRGVARSAMEDTALFERTALHREIFFRLGWVDYATLRRGSLRLTPPDLHRDTWRLDYDEWPNRCSTASGRRLTRSCEWWRTSSGGSIPQPCHHHDRDHAGTQRSMNTALEHVLRVNPDWAKLPLFDRKGWKRLPFGAFADSVNERVEPADAADEI